jgi:exopolysaccharide production protein ExoZ
MVVGFHLGFSVWANAESGLRFLRSDGYRLDDLAPYLWFGWIGVEVFFVISGFVIAASASGRTPVQFVRSRVTRLYPAAWICASITLLFLFWLGTPVDFGLLNRYVRSVTLFPLFPWIDPVYWTLAVEIVFYALVFVLILLGRLLWLPFVMLVITAIGFFYQVALLAERAGLDIPVFRELGPQIGRLSLISYGCFFAVGVLMWILKSQRPRFWMLPALALALMTCTMEIANHNAHVAAEMTQTDLSLGSLWWVPVSVWTIATFFIYLSATKSWTGIPHGLARQAGLMTYPLYLLHFTVGVAGIKVLHEWNGVPAIGAFLIASASVILMSWLVAAVGEPLAARPIRLFFDWISRSSNAPVLAALHKDGQSRQP